MKRTSVIGPLLLILIGGILLAKNLRPELALLDYAARYWPLVLIAWGALRLAEIVVWAGRRRPLPAAGISGGEWTLIILITVFGSAFLTVQRHIGHWPAGRIRVGGMELFGEAFDYTLGPQQRKVGKNPKVVIENARGNTRVVGADTEEVRVSGRKTVRALRRADADQTDRQTPLEITTAGDRLLIRTNQDRAPGDQRTSVDLEITVPRGASVEARGRLGDFEINDILGNVEIDSDNAGIRLQNIGGNARLETRKSDIFRVVGLKGALDIRGGRGEDVDLQNLEGPATVAGSFSGELQFRNLAKPLRFESSQTDLRVERTPGQLRLALGHVNGDNLVGPIYLKSRSRDIEINNFTESLEITIDRGDIELRPGRLPLSKMNVATKSGDITLALPDGAKFALAAATKHGDLQNEFGDVLKVKDIEGGGTIAGMVGQGPEIKLNTGRGAISLRKGALEAIRAGGPPAPPPPPGPPKKVEAEEY